MKRDYRKQIHALFEELRGVGEIKNKLQIMRLEALERMEERALDENSKEALDRIKEMVERGKRKVFTFPLAGKKIEIKDDKLVVTNL